MAQTFRLRHKDTGLVKTGFIGFSWTTLFFGPLPALFRLDFLTFIGYFAISAIMLMATSGILNFPAVIAWAFIYNKYYTRRLIERGYIFNGSGPAIDQAALQLGISSAA